VGLKINKKTKGVYMTKEERDFIQALRDKGYAITIFEPDELRGVSRKIVEDRMVELGTEVIEDLT